MGVVHGNGQQHDRNIHRLSPAVEQQAHRQQTEVAELQGREPVDRQHRRQVEEQKGQAGKDHGFSLPSRDSHGGDPTAVRFLQLMNGYANSFSKASTALDWLSPAEMRATTLPLVITWAFFQPSMVSG